MANKANAETLRGILWALERHGIEPENPEPVRMAARAPAEWLDRFGPDAFAEDFRRAGEALRAVGQMRRAAATINRIALEQCNGVPVGFDTARRAPIMGLTDEIAARHERDRERAKARIAEGWRLLMGSAADSLEPDFSGDAVYTSAKFWKPGERDTGSPVFTL